MVLFSDFPSWISPYVINGLPIRWYAVMYIVAFAVAYSVFRFLCNKKGEINLTSEESQDLFFWGILGLLLGARIGSCLLYSDTIYYLTHPWMMIWPFEKGKFVGLPGMSYHGGVVGATLGICLYCRKHKLSILKIGDLVTLSIPLGYFFGRLGNFINGELYGRVTESSIGMIFPYAERFSADIEWVRNIADKLSIEYVPGGYVNLPRFPSQLFEAFGEGILLFVLMYFVVYSIKRKKGLPDGILISSYIFGYGIIRFVIEYFRQPDSDIGYVLSLGEKSTNIYLFESVLNISKGQIYCLVMMAAGIILTVSIFAGKNKKVENDKRKNQQPKKGNGKGRH